MTTTNTSTFSFAGLELRCVTIEGEPWFAVCDIARIFGRTFTAHTLARPLSAEQKGTQTLRTPGGPQQTLMVNEAGLYQIVMRAQRKNPQARTFQDFVTGTVLPTIRKTGGYIQGEEKLATGEMTDEQFFALAVLKANTTIELMKAAACCCMR